MRYTDHTYKNPLYNTWKDMRKRCIYSSRRDYEWYGGKGITVCDRWKSFENFLEDMLSTYFVSATIDRLDNSKGYCKENCIWSTKSKQQLNRANVKGHWKKLPEVLRLRAEGYSQQRIATALKMSQGTVSNLLAGKLPDGA